MLEREIARLRETVGHPDVLMSAVRRRDRLALCLGLLRSRRRAELEAARLERERARWADRETAPRDVAEAGLAAALAELEEAA